MQNPPRTPGSLRFVIGMEHGGLSGAALELEQSADFKLAFVRGLARPLGFEAVDPELPVDQPTLHLAAFLDSFGPDGYPAAGEVERFLAAELAVRTGGGMISVGPEVAACCILIPPIWWTCSGFGLLQGGGSMTAIGAVLEYERTVAQIEDPAVRAELAAIEVRIRLEWPLVL